MKKPKMPGSSMKRADIDMGLYEYEKINQVFQGISVIMMRIRRYDPEALKDAYSLLREGFALIRPILNRAGPHDRKKFDDRFEKLKPIIDTYFLQHKLPKGEKYYALFFEIESVYMDLLDLKQAVNMHIRVSPFRDKKEGFANKLGGRS